MPDTTRWMVIDNISFGQDQIGLHARLIKACARKDLTDKTFYQELFTDFHIEGPFSKPMGLIVPESIIITNVSTWETNRLNHVRDTHGDIGFWIPELIQTKKLYELREVLYHAYTFKHHEGPTLKSGEDKAIGKSQSCLRRRASDQTDNTCQHCTCQHDGKDVDKS